MAPRTPTRAHVPAVGVGVGVPGEVSPSWETRALSAERRALDLNDEIDALKASLEEQTSLCKNMKEQTQKAAKKHDAQMETLKQKLNDARTDADQHKQRANDAEARAAEAQQASKEAKEAARSMLAEEIANIKDIAREQCREVLASEEQWRSRAATAERELKAAKSRVEDAEIRTKAAEMAAKEALGEKADAVDAADAADARADAERCRAEVAEAAVDEARRASEEARRDAASREKRIRELEEALELAQAAVREARKSRDEVTRENERRGRAVLRLEAELRKVESELREFDES
ncbi:hypothetical protein NFJ02_44g111380 [Pycnococcus provasolii]